jgi:hypothetical protein
MVWKRRYAEKERHMECLELLAVILAVIGAIYALLVIALIVIIVVGPIIVHILEKNLAYGARDVVRVIWWIALIAVLLWIGYIVVDWFQQCGGRRYFATPAWCFSWLP